MKFRLPKIYPITDESLTKLSHLQQVKELIKGGATFIQLREKYASPRDFYESAKKVLNYTRNSEIKIIINDRVDIALALYADGVHLGQDDLPPERARIILGENAIIGFSTHNTEQAIAASKLPLDYIAIGPIYETKSKENPDPIVGTEGLRIVRQALNDFPLVAIGGINAAAAQTVWQNGADSIALISSLLMPSDTISENTKFFLGEV
jgi:thiamine-phosphate pyrophosphorylase